MSYRNIFAKTVFAASLVATTAAVNLLTVQPASAYVQYTVPSDYQGNICVRGRQSNGAVRLRWDNWQPSFNPGKVNQRGSAGLQAAGGAAIGKVAPFFSIPGMAGKALLGVSYNYVNGIHTRVAGYSFQIEAKGDNYPTISISDNTAKMTLGNCAFYDLAPSY
jgi:hypothetical protein